MNVEQYYNAALQAWKRGRRVGFLEGLIVGLLFAGGATAALLR
jgi:hypothetical protein